MESRMKKIFIFFGILVLLITIIALIVVLFVVLRKSTDNNTENETLKEHVRPAWGYRCEQNSCKKVELTVSNLETSVSLPICRMFCGEDVGTIWPKPTGNVKISNDVMRIDLSGGSGFSVSSAGASSFDYFYKAFDRFTEMQERKKPKKLKIEEGGHKLQVVINVNSTNMMRNLDTEENYSLNISASNGEVVATITSMTFYGARNGLETLSQVIVYDDIRNEYLIVGSLEIDDAPKYKYRGISLDTSRNFYPLKSIKQTIEGMAMVKLNTFHWHITDSHSWPMVLKSHPEISRLGAYGPEKVYTPEDIKEVVEFGKVRGVRVMPELDAPAHVGEGFQNTDLVTCFKAQPWNKFCYEPPCGQFNPSKEELYDLLQDIYKEMWENFGNPDIFHMGGDEIHFNCWNISDSLRTWMTSKGWEHDEGGFMKVWNYFQENALERLDKVSERKVPIILWTSHLTQEPYLSQYLDKDRYIIQLWTKADEPTNEHFLSRGHKVIVSNHDVLYLDCGFPGWVTDKWNWCSPYHGWHDIYENKMENVVGLKYVDRVLGAEAALWSEQSDEYAVNSRIWPRASALAERLWSDPSTSWKEAESRLLMNRQRLVQVGEISADRLQPEWCLQNEGECPEKQ